MRLKIIAVLALFSVPLLLTACGTTEKTVVVTPEPGQTVVVTPSH